MNKFPTSYEIFGLYCLGEDAKDSMKIEYIHHCIDKCVSETLKPYKDLFNNKAFQFKQGEMELFLGPTGYIFNEDDSIVPVNSFMFCNSFMKLKGTKYEHLLHSGHIIKPTSDDERDYFEPIGLELDYAENHIDSNWDYYSDIDKKSYQRVVSCYREAAEDGNLNALWCLGCALNLRYGYLRENYDVFGLTYYYLFSAIQKGHLVCIPSLSERLMQDGMYKEAFMFTYIGAQKKEVYCMWNLAMYYLCGIIVPKSEDRAIELFEFILDIINAKDSDKTEFYNSHYNGINKDEILELKEYTEHNLKIIKSHCDSWKKYFDIEVCTKFKKINDILMTENRFDTSITAEKYASKIKDLMNQELSKND